ncbi:MAG: hypothetical protein KIT31_25250 [Deltaproteobacteria bacterium]|nr:hypothetical protein [Deltaproteobacteria bacterium]
MKRLICLALSLAAACGTPPKKDPTGPGPTKADDPTCPVLVAGTSVTVEDTDH